MTAKATTPIAQVGRRVDAADVALVAEGRAAVREDEAQARAELEGIRRFRAAHGAALAERQIALEAPGLERSLGTKARAALNTVRGRLAGIELLLSNEAGLAKALSDLERLCAEDVRPPEAFQPSRLSYIRRALRAPAETVRNLEGMWAAFEADWAALADLLAAPAAVTPPGRQVHEVAVEPAARLRRASGPLSGGDAA